MLQLRTGPRIAAHALWDQLTRPLAVSVTDVPWHAEAITAEWVTAVVGASSPGAKVDALAITGGSVGSSFRRGIAVRWNEAGVCASLPTLLFAKTTPTLATRLSAGMVAPMEGRFLKEVRPHLPLEAPVCLHTARDPTSGRSIHLFEDLTASRGAVFCHIGTVIGRPQAEDMIDSLSRLHGSFMTGESLEQVSWLRTYEHFFSAGQRIGVPSSHEQALTRAGDVIPPRVMERRAEIWPAAERAASAHAESSRTVIHSDVHLGNWYITADGRMGLGDWARVCRGLWARDVAYVLTTTLSVEDRRAWEDGLLDRYRANLADEFGVAIAADAARRAYRQQMFTALLMWTPTLCPPPTLPEMQPEAVSMEMIRRISAAIDDHRSLDAF